MLRLYSISSHRIDFLLHHLSLHASKTRHLITELLRTAGIFTTVRLEVFSDYLSNLISLGNLFPRVHINTLREGVGARLLKHLHIDRFYFIFVFFLPLVL